MKKNNNIKIGIFVDGGFIPAYDGATNRFQYLSRYLQKAGVDIVVFHCYRGWSDLNLIKKEPFKTYILPVRNYYHNLNLLSSLVREERIQIIQFNDLEPFLSIGLKLSNIANTHLVSEMHYVVSNLAKSLGLSHTRINKIRKYEKMVGASTDHVICLSKDDRPILLNRMAISNSRISVIPSGVDVRDIKFFSLNFNKRTVLFLGNLFFEPNAKALENIYKYIYPKLEKLNFQFLIAGDCPEYIQNKYKSINFEFTGAVKNLNNVFRRSIVALAPISEGTGMRIKILNYLAAGLPVIATKSAAFGFSDRKALIIENDFRKYPKIILKLINNPKDTMELSKKGRIIMDKKFRWETIARKTKLVYRKILNIPPKNKNEFVKKLSMIKINEEPAWLEETKKKGRFSDRSRTLNNKFSYAVIKDGKISIIKK